VAMAQSALSSLFFVIVYVSAPSADSIEWRKKGAHLLSPIHVKPIFHIIYNYLYFCFIIISGK
jgi:hypothetical protein